MDAAPGWYPDPLDHTQMRWFTGTEWSNETRNPPTLSQLPPPTTPPVAATTAVTSPREQPVTITGQEAVPQVGGGATVPGDADGMSAPPAPRPRRTATGSRALDIAIVSLCLFIFLMVGIALVSASKPGSPATSGTTTGAGLPPTDATQRWANWFDAQWEIGQMTADPARRQEVCAQYRDDPDSIIAGAAQEMWESLTTSSPEVVEQGLTQAVLVDGFHRNLRASCG